MSIDTDRAEVELSMKNARKTRDLALSLERLRSNRDFKALILDGYFREEAIRLVHLRSDPAYQGPEKQALLLLDIDAVANLASYFRTVDALGETARKALKDGEETLEHLAQDELAEGSEVTQ